MTTSDEPNVETDDKGRLVRVSLHSTCQECGRKGAMNAGQTQWHHWPDRAPDLGQAPRHEFVPGEIERITRPIRARAHTPGDDEGTT